jgi:superfamily II DNA or RNA helicase
VRVPLDPSWKSLYTSTGARGKFRVASENPAKTRVVEQILERHRGGRILVIGQYIDQLNALARHINAPLITGKTPTQEREKLYAAFKSGEITVLIVSKVGNFAVDLPEANVAIQISGTFGSRQEEAQRLGRILRPKTDGSAAAFYSIVTLGSRDQEFSEKRQLFLTEQGYAYEIVEAESLPNNSSACAASTPPSVPTPTAVPTTVPIPTKATPSPSPTPASAPTAAAALNHTTLSDAASSSSIQSSVVTHGGPEEKCP